MKVLVRTSRFIGSLVILEKGTFCCEKAAKQEGENLLFLAFVTLHKKTFRASAKHRERVADSLRFWSVMSPRFPADQVKVLLHKV